MRNKRKNILTWLIFGTFAGFIMGLLFDLVLIWTAVGAVNGVIIALTLNKLKENDVKSK